MGKSSLKFADVYFDMTRESFAAESIANIEGSSEELVKSIVDEYDEKLRIYNGKAVSEGQLKFVNDTANILCNDLKNIDNVVIVPAGAGYGKSVTIKTAVKKIVEHENNKVGFIIVSDKYKNLDEYGKELKGISYLMDRREDEYIYEQMAKQKKYPVVIMTSDMLKIMRDNLEQLEEFVIDEVICKRTTLIIDEKPKLLDSESIDLTFLGSIFADIEKIKIRVNSNDKDDREMLRVLCEQMRTTIRELIKKYDDKEFYIHKPHGGDSITSDDETFFRLSEKLGFDSKHKLKHIKRLLLEQGGLFYNKTYNNMNKQFFRTLGTFEYDNRFKTIVFDATADIDLEYNSEKYIFLDVEKRKKYDNVAIYNYNEVKWSKSVLVTDYAKNKHIENMCKWMMNKFAWNNKIYITTFKETGLGIDKILSSNNKYSLLRNKIVLTNDNKIPTYGATKGQNNWADCNIAIMFGNYIKTEDIYTAMAVSYFFMKEFTELPIDTLLTMLSYDACKGYDNALDFFRLTNIMVDLEQDIFRCAIRNYNSDKAVNIYTFGLNSIGTYYYDEELSSRQWTDLLGRLERRLGIQIKQIEEVPEEFDKVLNRGDGNSNVAQLIRWVKAYDGSPMLVDDFKTKFELSGDYWKKLFRSKINDKSIIEFQTLWDSKNIQRKANKTLGKGKWIYIE